MFLVGTFSAVRVRRVRLITSPASPTVLCRFHVPPLIAQLEKTLVLVLVMQFPRKIGTLCTRLPPAAIRPLTEPYGLMRLTCDDHRCWQMAVDPEVGALLRVPPRQPAPS